MLFRSKEREALVQAEKDKLKNSLFDDKTPTIQTNEELEVIDLTYNKEPEPKLNYNLFDNFDFEPVIKKPLLLTNEDEQRKRQKIKDVYSKYTPREDLSNKPIKKSNEKFKISDDETNKLIEDTYKKYIPKNDLSNMSLTDIKQEQLLKTKLNKLEKELNNSKREKTKKDKQEQISNVKNQLSKLKKSF